MSRALWSKMKKNAIKYLVNTLLFVDICSIGVIGFLMAFVIPEGRAIRGAKYFLGLHRHDWGDIHLQLSILLLVLLSFHIWFNWTWVVQSTKKYFGDHLKNALWIISAGWLLVLAIGYTIKRF